MADDDLAEVGAAGQVGCCVGCFLERKDAVDHRVQLVRREDPVHVLRSLPLPPPIARTDVML